MLRASNGEQLTHPAQGPWTVRQRSTVYENKWTAVIEEHLLGPQDQTGLYAYLAEKDCVIVCPLFPNRDIMLVQQWRHAFNCFTWELPCGVIEPGEDPLAAAQRELAEECQLQAADWTAYGSRLHSDARVRGRIHFFLARKIGETTAEKDVEEIDLIAKRVAFVDAVEATHDGEIEAIMTAYFLQRLAGELLPR